MKKIMLYSTSVVLSALMAGHAMAAPSDSDFDRPGDEQRAAQVQKSDAQNAKSQPAAQGDRAPQQFEGRDAPRAGDEHRGPHDGPQFKRGDRLPSHYVKNDRYYVRDWRAHDLRKPPRGYRWVDVDGRYILVSVVTGVIASILLNAH